MVATVGQFLLKVLKLGRFAAVRSLHRVFLFWKGGLWTYAGITLVVFQDNRQALAALVRQPNWSTLLDLGISIGTSVGTAAFRVVDALVHELPAASGLEYAAVVWTVIVGVVTISWYFRTTHVVAKGIEGGDVSPLLVLVFAVPLFLALVAVAVLAGEVEVAPLAEVVEAVRNVDQLLDWERLNPFGDGVNGSANESLQGPSVRNVTR